MEREMRRRRSESPAEHKVEMPSVGLAVPRKHIVESVAVIKADQADRVDLQARAETGGPLQIKEVRLRQVANTLPPSANPST